MIHYDLRCGSGHEFDGWFKDSEAYNKQAKAGFVQCPVCGGTEVTKQLMAPAIPKKGRKRVQEVPPRWPRRRRHPGCHAQSGRCWPGAGPGDGAAATHAVRSREALRLRRQ
ncbi:DUF1178 family protein [Siccirubricoccus deserti]